MFCRALLHNNVDTSEQAALHDVVGITKYIQGRPIFVYTKKDILN